MGNERLPRDGGYEHESEPEISSVEDALAIIEALRRSLAEAREEKEAALGQAAEERRLREEAEEHARWDPLLETMLNQREAMKRLEERIAQGEVFGIFMIDLDYFKRINDTYGHGAGNELLLLLQQLLHENLRREDDSCEFARIGGDEILLIMVNLVQDGDRSSDPIQQLENIREIVLRQRVEAGLRERDPRARAVGVGLSVGIAIFDPQNPVSAAALKDEADAKLYEDKRRRHGRDSSR